MSVVRPIVRPIVRSIIRGSAFDPLSLFANGEQGAFYLPEPQYLYQDSAGTIPVTADGDPVGYMEDLSGNENHATQTTASLKPIYRTDGSLHWLSSDGFDDRVFVEYGTLLEQPAILSIAQKIDSGSAKVLATGFTTTNRHQISSDANSNLIIFAGTSLDSGANTPLAKSVITGFFNGTESRVRVSGASVSGNAGSLSSDGLTLFALPDGSAASTGDFFGLVHVENAGGAVSTIEEYLAQKSGVAL